MKIAKSMISLWLLHTSSVLIGPPCSALQPPSPHLPLHLDLYSTIPFHFHTKCAPGLPSLLPWEVISVFPYCWDLCSNIWSNLEKASWLLRRICILQCLLGILYRCLLGPFDLWCHLAVMFLFIFCLNGPSIGGNRVQKWSTIAVLELVCDFISCIICFVKLGTLVLACVCLEL